MPQSYHAYRRRVRCIYKARWHTFLDAILDAGGMTGYQVDALDEELRPRTQRLLKLARRLFEQQRRKQKQEAG